MYSTRKTLISAAFGLLLLSAPAFAGDTLKLIGTWKLVAFFTEDVQTKARNHVYGEHPQGYLGITPQDRFFAFATADWRRFAQPPAEEIEFRSIFFSGKYRLQENKFIIQADTVWNEGWEGPDPFDMSWNEGWVGTEQMRFYQLENNGAESERLRMQTAPIPNPNGAGNTIVGTLIWERSAREQKTNGVVSIPNQ
jgi:Lipocalin-like domain